MKLRVLTWLMRARCWAMAVGCWLLSGGCWAAGNGRPAEVVWFDGAQPVSYELMGAGDKVVQVALQMFSDDMTQVTGLAPQAQKDGTIRIYQLDRQRPSVLRRLSAMGLPVGEVQQSADAFFVGVSGAHVVVLGSNGRGTAYGLLELSRQAGVSPWVWWGDVVPQRRSRLTMGGDFSTLQSPSVAYRGIFINDEDWSLREWASKTFDPSPRSTAEKVAGRIGPRTYKELFKLLLRLRGNAVWPAMHEGTAGFFTVAGNKEMADSCGILIGTSHCEPLLRNNVAEWDAGQRGRYNYMTNREAVKQYWTERLREVAGSEELFTIGMRGIHDGSMEGVRTKEEKLAGLQQVIDDQRELLRRYVNKDLTRVPQVFIPYKEVLEIMESGLRVPDDVMLMWCDDNYGYMTRLSDARQQQRSGGGGVYYHLSYWGRPHDYLWLTTTQPGLIYSEMRAAYDHHARRLWIANVHDPKVAAYDLELFMDMAWDIHAVSASALNAHLERWLCTQFGEQVGRNIAPAMRDYYRLCAQRKPEFMGWTQVELDKRVVPGGKSRIDSVAFTLNEACQRLAAFGSVEAVVDANTRLVPEHLRDAYFAHVLYPVHAAAAMSRKILSDPVESRRAYEEIQALTERYDRLNGGKWARLMSAAPRGLPVYENTHAQLAEDNDDACRGYVVRQACQYTTATAGAEVIQMLGHSMNAVALPKGGELTYDFRTTEAGEALLWTALIPTQPNDKGDLRYEVQLDDQPPTVYSLKEPYRSEEWKRNVLRGQARRRLKVSVGKGDHTLRLRALDDHIIVDQWLLDFQQDRRFYLFPQSR